MSTSTITTTNGPPSEQFEQFRRELTGYSYRMLGSSSEADDAVQETFLKAWRSWESFEARSSVRTWLYRIAHHVCVDMHRSPQRRARPMDFGPATPAADVVLGEAPAEIWWIEPIADAGTIDTQGDPADAVAARESIRLALVTALQRLPARQRSALILCDVLRWSAAEAAELLETSTASVNSSLQRARATLAELDGEDVPAAVGPEEQAMLDRYVEAFERYDIEALVAMMRDDVVLTMPPYPLWLQGPDQLSAWYLGQGSGCRGSKLVPIEANGTTAFASYRRVVGETPGRWKPFSIQFVDIIDGQITAQHNYLTPERFSEFGLPSELSDG